MNSTSKIFQGCLRIGPETGDASCAACSRQWLIFTCGLSKPTENGQQFSMMLAASKILAVLVLFRATTLFTWQSRKAGQMLHWTGLNSAMEKLRMGFQDLVGRLGRPPSVHDCNHRICEQSWRRVRKATEEVLCKEMVDVRLMWFWGMVLIYCWRIFVGGPFKI